MARRPDHGQDATQELSASQILRDLPPKPRAAPPRPKVPVNDVSMWGRKVVGSEEFAPMPIAPGRSRRWMIGAVLGAAALAGAGYAVLSHTDDEPTAPAMVVDHTDHSDHPDRAPEAPATPPPNPAVAAKAGEVKPATKGTGSGSAAPAPATGSGSAALVSTTAGAGSVAPPDKPDAVSSVAPIVKPPIAKKPAIKTAAAPVKRPPLRKPPARKPPPKRRTR